MSEIGSIKGKVELDARNYKTEIEKIKKDTKQLKKNTDEVKGSLRGVEGALNALGATAVFAGMVGVIRATVTEASKLEMSMRGLVEIAKSLNKDIDAVTQSAQNMASEGFMTATESAEAYKTALAMGLELEEATSLINALGDAAAYNRESHLGWGEAVVNAMRGIKMGESTLTDSAGITTNLSVMYDRYAKQIGTTAAKLTEAEKIQAAYNGMLEEAQLFAGNAESAMDGYQGALSKYNNSMSEMKAEIGEAFLPILADTMEALTPIITSIAKWANENPNLVVSIAGVTTGVTGLIAVLTTGAFAFNTLRTAVIGLNVALGPTGWLIAGISLLIPALTTTFLTLDKVSTSANGTTNKMIETERKTKDLAREYDQLSTKLNELEENSYDAIQAKERMAEIMETLKISSPDVVEAYNQQTDAINTMTGAYENNTRAALDNLKVQLSKKKTELDELKSKSTSFRGGLLTEGVLTTSKRAEIFAIQQEIASLEAILDERAKEIGKRETEWWTNANRPRPDNPYGTNQSSSDPKSSGSSPRSKTAEEIARERFQESMRWIQYKKSLNQMSLEQEKTAYQRLLDRYSNYSKIRMQLNEEIYRTEKALQSDSVENSISWIRKEERKMLESGATTEEVAEMKLAAWERVKTKFGENVEYQERIEQELHNAKMTLLRAEESAYDEYIRNRKSDMDDLKRTFFKDLSEMESGELDSLSRRKQEIENYYNDQISQLDQQEVAEKRYNLQEEIEKYKYATSKKGKEKYEELQKQLRDLERSEQKKALREERDTKLKALEEEKRNIQAHFNQLRDAIEDYTSDVRTIEELLQDDRIKYFKEGNADILSSLRDFVNRYNQEVNRINVQTVIAKMKQNSQAWFNSNDAERQKLANDNKSLGESQGWTRKNDGHWYDDSGKRVYHTGGRAGEFNFSSGEKLLPNEINSVLQKGEWIFQDKQLAQLLSANESKGGNTIYNEYKIEHNGDVRLEDEADVSTFWRERELIAQRLAAGGDR